MTLREVVATEVSKLLKGHSPKDVAEITGLNSVEIQNILRNGTPNLRYFTIISVALKLGINIEDYLIDKRIKLDNLMVKN